MRLYKGKPKLRLSLVHERFMQEKKGEPFRMALPSQYDFEIIRIWGISLCGIFIGVQRFVRKP